ncbi:MAG: type II toxin-antitoxin system death-on-curing family toxin [Armatimonadota bacterium]
MVLEIHADELRRRGGQPGLRDEGLLESALAQPEMRFEGEYVHADVFTMAAAHVFHIGGNHPFVDGNKRTGLACALVFLEANGYHVREEPEKLADLVTELIERGRSKDWFAEQLRTRARRI